MWARGPQWPRAVGLVGGESFVLVTGKGQCGILREADDLLPTLRGASRRG